MPKILVNDGMHQDGQKMLENAGYEVNTNKIAQEDLAQALPDYDVIVVRSATKVREDLINACPNLKIIARGGVGLDNIDVNYAENKGIKVINTPSASSQSVAELAIGHMFNLARHLHDANRNMPSKGATDFKSLKKQYAKGVELRGKTIGILGFGRIGQYVARMAIGLGMNVIPVDLVYDKLKIDLDVLSIKDVDLSVTLKTEPLDNMLAKADFITVHVPFKQGNKALIGAAELAKMKDGVFLVNTARGGVFNEEALLQALDSGKVAAAALDVFENEPNPDERLLSHPKVSLSPHIGASTLEAQRNIGLELADKIMSHFEN